MEHTDTMTTRRTTTQEGVEEEERTHTTIVRRVHGKGKAHAKGKGMGRGRAKTSVPRAARGDNALEHRAKILDGSIREQAKQLVDSEKEQHAWPQLFSQLQRQLRNYRTRMHEAKSLERVQGEHAVLFESGDPAATKRIATTVAGLRRANARLRAQLRRAGGTAPAKAKANACAGPFGGAARLSLRVEYSAAGGGGAPDGYAAEDELREQRTADSVLKKRHGAAESAKARALKLTVEDHDGVLSDLADAEKQLARVKEQRQRVRARLANAERKRRQRRAARHCEAQLVAEAEALRASSAADVALSVATRAAVAARDALSIILPPRSRAAHVAVVQSLVRRRQAQQQLGASSPIALVPMERWSARQRLVGRRQRKAQAKQQRVGAAGTIQKTWRRHVAYNSERARSDRETMAILRAQAAQIAMMRGRLEELERSTPTPTSAPAAASVGKKRNRQRKA